MVLLNEGVGGDGDGDGDGEDVEVDVDGEDEGEGEAVTANGEDVVDAADVKNDADGVATANKYGLFAF